MLTNAYFLEGQIERIRNSMHPDYQAGAILQAYEEWVPERAEKYKSSKEYQDYLARQPVRDVFETLRKEWDNIPDGPQRRLELLRQHRPNEAGTYNVSAEYVYWALGSNPEIKSLFEKAAECNRELNSAVAAVVEKLTTDGHPLPVWGSYKLVEQVLSGELRRPI